jgi:hypothetical protein
VLAKSGLWIIQASASHMSGPTSHVQIVPAPFSAHRALHAYPSSSKSKCGDEPDPHAVVDPPKALVENPVRHAREQMTLRIGNLPSWSGGTICAVKRRPPLFFSVVTPVAVSAILDARCSASGRLADKLELGVDLEGFKRHPELTPWRRDLTPCCSVRGVHRPIVRMAMTPLAAIQETLRLRH